MRHSGWRILVPQPEIEPLPLAEEAQSLNHWTTREVSFTNKPSWYSKQKKLLFGKLCVLAHA